MAGGPVSGPDGQRTALAGRALLLERIPVQLNRSGATSSIYPSKLKTLLDYLHNARAAVCDASRWRVLFPASSWSSQTRIDARKDSYVGQEPPAPPIIL